MRITRNSVVILLILLVVLLAGSNPAADAATITVNSLADTVVPGDGNCTLRKAIANANNNAATYSDCAAGSGTDVINITATGTITLLSALPDLTGSLTINGPGSSSLSISGGNTLRVFYLSGSIFIFQNLQISNGSADFGAGIRATGADSVLINNVTFFGNNATNRGGAIYSGSGNPMTVTNSTFIANGGNGGGGAIQNSGQATLTVTNSTFSGNIGGYSGGTINQDGQTGSTTLTNITVSSSDAFSAIYIFQGTLSLRNSIVINDIGPSCEANPPFTITNNGNNIDNGASCGWGSTNGSMSSVTNPMLGALANNGGPTQTMALLTGSPAIDGVTSTSPTDPATDQRGITRPQGALDDIGAYELDPPQQATSVPTMTEWGMIVFTLFAGLASVYYLRKRAGRKVN